MGDDFRFVSVFIAELGSTADTCGASVYGAFVEAHIFPVIHALIATTGAMVMGCRKLWSLRSWCCPFLSPSTAVSAASMVSQMSWTTSNSGDGDLAASVTGKTTERDKPSEAQLSLPACTHRKSGKPSFRLWPSPLSKGGEASFRPAELYTKTKRRTYEKKEHPHSEKGTRCSNCTQKTRNPDKPKTFSILLRLAHHVSAPLSASSTSSLPTLTSCSSSALGFPSASAFVGICQLKPSPTTASATTAALLLANCSDQFQLGQDCCVRNLRGAFFQQEASEKHARTPQGTRKDFRENQKRKSHTRAPRHLEETTRLSARFKRVLLMHRWQT